MSLPLSQPVSRPEPLVPYRLSICGLAELPDHSAAGISHVFSILDPDWPEPVAFQAFTPHRRLTWRFDDVVAPRQGVMAPEVSHVAGILESGADLADDKTEHLLIHCHAGISRSTAAAVILMLRENPGRETDAFAAVARVRPKSWPNALMLSIADDLLGRGGAIMGALVEHQRRIAIAFPEFAQMLRGTERAHEVPDL